MKKQLLVLTAGTVLLVGGMRAEMSQEERDKIMTKAFTAKEKSAKAKHHKLCFDVIEGYNGWSTETRVLFLEQNCSECPEMEEIIAKIKAAANIIDAEELMTEESQEVKEEVPADLTKDPVVEVAKKAEEAIEVKKEETSDTKEAVVVETKKVEEKPVVDVEEVAARAEVPAVKPVEKVESTKTEETAETEGQEVKA